MKYILVLLTFLLVHTAYAQKGGVQVSAQTKTIYVNLDNEDAGKVLTINRKLKSIATGKLSISNLDWSKEKEWKRTFSIYSDEDEAIIDITPCKASGKYEVSLKRLVSKIVKGKKYSLYTIAIPKDPKKAALVRVRRVLVCSISFT